jgi:hypothetical protein
MSSPFEESNIANNKNGQVNEAFDDSMNKSFEETKPNTDTPKLELSMEKVKNDPETKKKKREIIKNLLVVGLSWIFLFTAYSSMANLQSSLNSDGGLGTISLSTIYVSLILSCIFIPTVLIQHLGIKWTIFCSQITYILFIAANIYPRYFTLIPSAIILGCKFTLFFSLNLNISLCLF